MMSDVDLLLPLIALGAVAIAVALMAAAARRVDDHRSANAARSNDLQKPRSR